VELSSHNIAKASKKVISEQETKVKMLRMFKTVQTSIKNAMSAQEAFSKIDPVRHDLNGQEYNLGFLTLWNFQANFAKNLDLSLNKDEVRELFKEIDTDQNGMVTFDEFDKFY
jgi:Ca2+-binding EF-hand superfamily protein